jgi:hypothetical protein
MQIKLAINPRTFKHLVKSLGEDRVSVISIDADGYVETSFEIRHDMDALYLIHAGQDSGLELAHYGPNGKPEENKVEVTVA